ncbi:MAG: hypothetical protein L6Q93_16190 [Phycisphaerae bacterium]|nr:hypothetical protein [Phycisphaerae bacterium]NUQ10358.1 hypothetical protein [Phycisphaerae bacterium]
MAISSGELNVQGKQFGGEAVFTGHMDDDFIAEVQVKLNSGKDAAIYFRYLDPDNWYRARLQGTPSGAVLLEKMLKGKLTTLERYCQILWTVLFQAASILSPLTN